MLCELSSRPALTNCTFSGNSAGVGGGAWCWMSGNPALTNCTFSGNTAGTNGGGMYCTSSSPTLTTCILWANSSEINVQSGSPPIIAYSDVRGGYTGAGNISGDPQFVRNPDPSSGDYGDLHLRASSPCINAGDPNYVPAHGETDLDGNLRIVNGRVDMGAYEYAGLDFPLRTNHGDLRLSQRFGAYFEGEGGFHSADDMLYENDGDGTRSVYAIGAGTVAKVSDLGVLGTLVGVEHPVPFTIPGQRYTCPTTGQSYVYPTTTVQSIYSVYIHLENVTVVAGDPVTKDTKLGSYMNPGGGYHLHFEIRRPGTTNSNNWSLFGRQSNWAVVSGAYTGYYLNLQAMVDDGGVDPVSFIYANSPRDTSGLFHTGDAVRVTWGSLRVRSCPATWDGTVITSLDVNAQGQVVDATNTGFSNGVFADGYYWWYVKFGGTAGWCAQDGLRKPSREGATHHRWSVT